MGKVLKKYKPQIQDAVVHLKDVVIACGKDIVIQVKDGIVKIITDGATAMSDDSDASEFYFEGDYVMLIFNNDDSEIVYGFKDAWAKVKDAFKKLGDKIKATSEDLWKKIVPVAGPVIEKYKDLIVKALQRQGTVIIDEGKKIVITVINDVVKVIIDGIEAVSGKLELEAADENGWKEEIWGKVTAAAEQLKKKIKTDVTKIIGDYKPKIVEALKGVGKIVIEAGKEWVIEVRDGIVKIISETGEEGTSSGETFESEENAVSIVYSSTNSIVGDKILEIWIKVVNAFHRLGQKISEAAQRFAQKMAGLGDKIGGEWGKRIVGDVSIILEKYKDIIVTGLKHLGKVVIKDTKTIVVEIIQDTVKIIVDGIHSLGGKLAISSETEEYGLKEIWEKVKAAVEGYFGHYKEELKKMVTKYKPKILEQLQKFKKVVIDEGKQLVIDMLGDAIKIIIRGGIGYESQDNGLKETWGKVKDAFKRLGDKIKATSEDLWKKIIPVAGPVIEKYKDLIIKALEKQGTVVIDEGKKIVITVINDVVKVIIDGMEAVSKKIEYESEIDPEDVTFAVMVRGPNSAVGDKIKEIWGKVKAAFQRFGQKIADLAKAFAEKMAGLGEKIKTATAGIRAKISEIAQKWGSKIMTDLINIALKYKDAIIAGLKHMGKVVIDDTRKIVIEIFNDTVQVIIDGIH